MVPSMDTPVPARTPYDPELPATRAQELLARLQRRAARRKSLWNGHVAGFVSINAFLVFIDAITRGGPWAPFAIGAMSIPLIAHWIHKRRKERLQQKLSEVIRENPDLPDRIFRPMRKHHRSGTHFLMALGSGAAISGYVFLVDFLVRGQPFALIVAASISLPLIFLGLFSRARRQALLRQIEGGGDARPPRRRERLDRQRREGLPRDIPRQNTIPGVHPMLTEARRVEQEIATRIAQSGAAPDELLAGVQQLVTEIESMCSLSLEFARAVDGMPAGELQKDRATLQKKLKSADEQLSRQYADALSQVERQLLGLDELNNRRELLELRIRTGVNSLREINVGLLRIQGDAALGEVNRMVRDRTEELSGYLNDLQRTYQELSEEFGGL